MKGYGTAAALGAWWAACAWLAGWSHFYKDPPVPGRAGTALYGHNAPGQFEFWLPIMAVELAVLLVLVLKVKRIVPAFVLALAGATLLIPFGMHQGTVFFAHLFWVWGAVLILMLAGTGRMMLQLKQRRRSPGVDPERA